MATMTRTEREAMFAVRAAMNRLNGPQAPIASSPLDRIEFMRRHFDEIDKDVRLGTTPAPTHLSALAAHCVILYMRGGDRAGA